MVKPKNSPYIAGIDLGTSNSTIAIYAKGHSDVIPIDSRPMLPSVVHMRDSGEILVGYPAKNQMLIDPENTVASVKREMGNPAFEKEFKGQPDKKYSATDLSSEILAKIRAGVDQAGVIDLRGSLRYAVICIPANFDDTKKQATLEAGRLAGFEVLRLLEEPVAAAIAYAVEAKRDQKILVYDLGGGTFDVSILNVDSTEEGESQFQVLAKEGIPDLGGDDFDRAIMDIAAKDFQEKSGIDLFNLKKDQGINRKALRQAQQKLKEAAENAKFELSEADSSEIIIPNFLKDESGNVHNVEYELSKEQFEEAVRDLLAKTRATIEKALDSAKLSIDDISRIILIGGSTKVPLVREIVTEMFDKEPYCDIDPATAVARGAAIMGAALGVPAENLGDTAETNPEDTPDVQINIADIVTHYLGIQVANRRFSKVLDKGVEIPPETGLVSQRDFINAFDLQRDVRISVYQASEETEYVSDEGCVCIGEFFLTGLPPKKKGEVHIDVTFEINQQNLLTVSANMKGEEGVKIGIDRS